MNSVTTMPRRPAPDQVICQPPWERIDVSELHVEIAARGREISWLLTILLFSGLANLCMVILYIAPHFFGAHK